MVLNLNYLVSLINRMIAMRNSKFFSLGMFVILVMPGALKAQMQVTTGIFTPQQLVENVFLSIGVDVLDVNYVGSNQSIGYFSNADNNIAISSGVVLSTGFANSAAFPNNSGSTTGSTSGAGVDPDLNILVGQNLNDISVLEITFIPYSDTLEFRYVFASEEYQEYVCTAFNDVFGFFISGPGISGTFQDNAENIALVPNTSNFVAINTVNNGNPNMNPAMCPPQNPIYFNLSPQNGQPTYDGFTDVFVSKAVVVPCEVYKIRLAIADVGDGAFDSGVFLEARSFGTPAVVWDLGTTSVNQTIAEGCDGGIGTFSISNTYNVDVNIPISFIGSATYGVDYEFNPMMLSIPAGSQAVSTDIIVFSDGVLEGKESIGIVYPASPCFTDTVWFYITDDTLVKPDLGLDLESCPLDLVALDGELNMVLPSPVTFENVNNFQIPSPPDLTSPLTPVRSPITVSGIFPVDLGPGVINSVCINIDHLWIDDVDVYLISPNGKFVELTTDNGGDGDHYTETCFSPTASQPIDYGNPFGAPASAAPFTGTFQPEGNWSDLWSGADNPTNGEWVLLLSDDAPIPDGQLLNWRITFNPDYKLNYTWGPGNFLSCDTCSQLTGIFDQDSTLILEVTDSYGCKQSDTIQVTMLPEIEAPQMSCANQGFNDLEIEWPAQNLNESYEISINGGPWVMINPGDYGYFLDGLGLLDSVTFVLRAIGPCNELTDTIGCRTIDCIPPQIEVTQVINPSCNGFQDGGFTVAVIAPDNEFELSMNGSLLNPGNVTNLGPGTYQLNVTDTLGCTDELMVVLTDPDLLEVTDLVLDSVTCAGLNDGGIRLTVDGGTYPYQFIWSDNQTDSILSDLSAGTYTVTITDINLCETILNVDVYEFPPIDGNLVTSDPTCQAPQGGTILVDVNGGTGFYQYLWQNPLLSGSNLNNLSPGTYTVTITDENQCQEVLQTVLASPLNFIVESVVATPTSCFGGMDGAITITVSGGMPPINFAWSDGGPNLNQRLDLLAGDYTITITDQDGCEEVVMASVFDPNPINLSVTATNVRCNGEANGSATAVASGGGGGITFAWSNNQNGPTINNLNAGTYFVTATDASGCTMVDTVVVSQPNPLTVIFDAKQINCFGGSDGSITASPLGGNGGFTYLWNDPLNTTNNTLENASAGTYTVTITDMLGCTIVDSSTLISPPVFSSVLFPDLISCFGAADGGATVNPLGGTPPYNYVWSDPQGQTGPVVSGLTAGTYYVTITDNRNCKRVDTLDLIEPGLLVVNINAINVTCSSNNDGRAQAMVSGGTSPYSFSWSTGAQQANIQNLAPGSYQLTVTDNRGCTDVQSVNILPAVPIEISGQATNISCAGYDDGSIQTQVTGGNDPYTYKWNNGSIDPNPQNLTNGIYVVTVTDASNCTKTFNITITSPPGMNGELQKADIPCFGEVNGEVNSTISGGSPGYTYLWSNGSTDPAIGGLAPGTYALTVTDQSGCTIFRSVEILQPLAPLSAEMIGDTLECAGDKDGRITFLPMGGTPNYNFSLDGVTYNGSSIQIGLGVGLYQGFIRDKNGCELIVGQALIEAPLPMLLDLGEDIFIDLGVDTQLMVQVTDGIAPYTYSWFIQDSSFLSCLTCPDPVVSGLSFTRTFRVMVTDANGCNSEETITVHVQKERIVLVPTAFTPNQDGQNDRLGVVGRPGTIIRNFQIFDRWGERVFVADEFMIEDGGAIDNSWDGTFRETQLNSAVFVWSLEAEFVDGEKTFLRGQTTLVR